MREAQPNLAVLRVHKFMNLHYGALQIANDRLGPFTKQLSDGRKLEIPPLLHKELHAKLFFELVNLPADRRLRHMQLLCRACDVLPVRHLHKIIQLPQFHNFP